MGRIRCQVNVNRPDAGGDQQICHRAGYKRIAGIMYCKEHFRGRAGTYHHNGQAYEKRSARSTGL